MRPHTVALKAGFRKQSRTGGNSNTLGEARTQGRIDLRRYGLSTISVFVFLCYGTMALAQGASVRLRTTTAAQQTAISQAVSFLDTAGESVPEGWTVSNGDVGGNAPGAADPDSKTIFIDFERIEDVVSGNTPGAPGHPGLVVIVLFHKLAHVVHGWGGDPCTELELAAYVAGKQCEFICFLDENEGGPLDAQCTFYNHVKDVVNGFVGNALRQHCGSSTTIPECPKCLCD